MYVVLQGGGREHEIACGWVSAASPPASRVFSHLSSPCASQGAEEHCLPGFLIPWFPGFPDTRLPSPALLTRYLYVGRLGGRRFVRFACVLMGAGIPDQQDQGTDDGWDVVL